MDVTKENVFLCISDGSKILDILSEKNLSITEQLSKIEERKMRDVNIWAFEYESFWGSWNYKDKRFDGKKMVTQSVLRKVKSINSFFDQQVPTGQLMVELVDVDMNLVEVYRQIYRKLKDCGFVGQAMADEFESLQEDDNQVKLLQKKFIQQKLNDLERDRRGGFDSSIRKQQQNQKDKKDLDSFEVDQKTGFLVYDKLDDEVKQQFAEMEEELQRGIKDVKSKHPILCYSDFFLRKLFFEATGNNRYLNQITIENYLEMTNSLKEEFEFEEKVLERNSNFQKITNPKIIKCFNQDLLVKLFKKLTEQHDKNTGSSIKNIGKIIYNNQSLRNCVFCKKGSCKSCPLIPYTDFYLQSLQDSDFLTQSINFEINVRDLIENSMKICKDKFSLKNLSLNSENLLTKKKVTISSCFEAIEEEEEMGDDCQVDCDSCKQKTKSSLKTCIDTAGDQLIIHLKRFKTEIYKGDTIKLKNNIPVAFEETLELNDSKYELYSVIDHMGNELDKGHYIANCKIEDKWVAFDDDEIKSKEFKSVMTEKAYLMFYRRL